jgi:16S rRNA (cytosine1402-N4)-methyltransferase
MSLASQGYRPRTMCSLAIATGRRETSSAISSLVAIERLQVAHSDYHKPVLVNEITELLANLPSGVIVDATLGGGGHSAALLERSDRHRVLGIDRDPEAREHARKILAPFAGRVRIVDATFSDIERVVSEAAEFIGDGPVVAVLMDLGVSSHQLDDSSRGFSFRADAPLDMRMDPTKGETAAQLLRRIDAHELARLFRESGETRFAGAIARSVIERQPTTTNQLTDAVERAVPMAARRRGHVATRVFQALRIAVNSEEAELDEGLAGAMSVLADGGLLVVISYHSGEDRVVKHFLANEEKGGCTCPPLLPCVCGATPRAKVFRASAQLASAAEIQCNPRARSARLRIARKVAP